MSPKEQLLSFSEITFPIYLATLSAVMYFPPYQPLRFLAELVLFPLIQLWTVIGLCACSLWGMKTTDAWISLVILICAGGSITYMGKLVFDLLLEANLCRLLRIPMRN